MQLLNPIPPSELPAEALYARLRSRRAELMARSVSLDVNLTQPELELRSVFDWLYRHLNQKLRRHLNPYLEVLAMRQLILVLRYRMAGELPPPALRRTCLLHPGLLDRIWSEADPPRLVGWLQVALMDNYSFLKDLDRAYRQQGPGGVERQLGMGILVHARSETVSGIVQWLMIRLIDLRNLMTLFKQWHWQVQRSPPLVSGGQLSCQELQQIWERQDTARLRRLVARDTGLILDSQHSRAAEQSLLTGLSRQLHKAGRDPLGPGLILDYLWRYQVWVHNQLVYQSSAGQTELMFGETLLL